MDALFYNSYKKARNFYMMRSVYNIVKILLLVIFLPIDIHVIKTSNTLLVILWAVGIGVSVVNLAVSLAIYFLGYGDNEQNNRIILNLAAAHEHAVLN